MLSYNEITPGKYIEVGGEPYEVLSSHVFRKQQRKPVNQTKIRNMVTGRVTEPTFHSADNTKEAAIESKEITYLYNNRGEFWFCALGNPKDRFTLSDAIIGDAAKFLKENEAVSALVFNEKIISIKPPVKAVLKVAEAPPGIRGNSAQGATKQVVLETGAMVTTPLFINAGDIIRVNTQTGEYVDRVEKA